jgi:hypothetical protein
VSSIVLFQFVRGAGLAAGWDGLQCQGLQAAGKSPAESDTFIPGSTQ